MQEIIKPSTKETPVISPKAERPPAFPPRHDDAEANRRIKKLDIDSVVKNVTSFGDESKSRVVFEALARLVIELEKEIPNYDTLLSDDASGRLVTRFLREVINKKREAVGKPRVQTYFIAGGWQALNAEYIQEFIRQKKSSIHKALLVTELVGTGESANRLVKIFEQEGLDFDVAAVTVHLDFLNSDFIYAEEVGGLVKRLRYGDDRNRAGVSFYDKPFTGVTKRGVTGAHPVKDPYADRDAMKRAWQDMKLMAEEISKLIL